MKRVNLLAIAALMLCTGLAMPTLAEDNIFGNLNTTPPPASTDVQAESTKPAVVVRGSKQMENQESLTTQSLQTSITSLEAAQADLRTKLETAQTNYTAVDSEYVQVKAERAALKKIVKNTNSRIKDLEKTKKKIQKTIQATL